LAPAILILFAPLQVEELYSLDEQTLDELGCVSLIVNLCIIVASLHDPAFQARGSIASLLIIEFIVALLYDPPF
jgi:hypothetical protein